MIEITERARRYIVRCPPGISGQGGHGATFRAAAVLVHGFALDEGTALTLLRQWNSSCVPPWSEADLVHKIRSARAASHSLPRGHLLGDGAKHPSSGRHRDTSSIALTPSPSPIRRARVASGSPQRGEGTGNFGESPKWTGGSPVLPRQWKPKFCPMVLKRIAGKVEVIANVLDFVRLASPVPVDSQDSAGVLRRLYRPGSGEKVLIFADMKSQGQLLWEADRGDEIANDHLPMGEAGVWFLPQPVTGLFSANPRMGGKLSRRSEEAVTSWRFAVLESDEAEPDDWLRCLIQMPLRIACICESGGRSIHALVRVDADSKVDWDARMGSIKPLLITLGADRGALTAVRLSRLPQALRGERVQRLLYLNPEPDSTPIVRLGGSGEGSL